MVNVQRVNVQRMNVQRMNVQRVNVQRGQSRAGTWMGWMHTTRPLFSLFLSVGMCSNILIPTNCPLRAALNRAAVSNYTMNSGHGCWAQPVCPLEQMLSWAAETAELLSCLPLCRAAALLWLPAGGHSVRSDLSPASCPQWEQKWDLSLLT